MEITNIYIIMSVTYYLLRNIRKMLKTKQFTHFNLHFIVFVTKVS